jgi:hypothetical protein
MRELLFTKFEDWKYENEYRISARLVSDDGGLYFYDFYKHMRLEQVIVGARSTLKRKSMEKLLRSYGPSIRLTKARLAFKTFRVIPNEQGFGGSR